MMMYVLQSIGMGAAHALTCGTNWKTYERHLTSHNTGCKVHKAGKVPWTPSAGGNNAKKKNTFFPRPPPKTLNTLNPWNTWRKDPGLITSKIFWAIQ